MKRSIRAVKIGKLIDELFAHKRFGRGLKSARVRLSWEEIVGSHIAAHARPGKLERGRLIVHCDHDVWRTELAYLRPEIIKRIAEQMGDDKLVKEIWLK